MGLFDLIFAGDVQRVIEFALRNTVGFGCQTLQRTRDHPQTEAHRDHRHDRQDDDHQRQRHGNVQCQLLRALRRNGQHDRPRTPKHRLVILQLTRAVRSGVVEEEGFVPALTRICDQ